MKGDPRDRWKIGHVTLDRKGLKKRGGSEYYTRSEEDFYVGGQAQMIKKLNKKGLAIGTDHFPKNSVAHYCCAKVEAARFVLPPALDYKDEPVSSNKWLLMGNTA